MLFSNKNDTLDSRISNENIYYHRSIQETISVSYLPTMDTYNKITY